jgi:hypothetical protein
MLTFPHRRPGFVAALLAICCACSCSSDPPAAGKQEVGEPVSGQAEEAVDRDPFAEISPDIELDKKKQDEIWLAEHVTFELEQRFGKRFTGAWKTRNRDELLAMVRPDFRAQSATWSAGTTEHEFVSQQIFTPEAGSSPVLAEEWCTQVLELTRPFAKFSWTTFRVLKIHRRPEEPQRWTTRILLGAAGENDEGRLVELSTEHDVVFEVPEDPKQVAQVAVLESWSMAARTLLTARQPLFREVTQEYGLAEIDIDDNWKLPADKAQQYRFQMAVEDFDRDGWLDLAVAEQHRSRLLRFVPEKGRFEDVTIAMGLMSMHLMFGKPVDLAGWLDYDNDGYPDLLLGNRLYHNDGGRHFTDITQTSGLSVQRQGMGVLVADYDADGLLDIYILYQASVDSERPDESALRWIGEVRHGEKNRLWRNLGNGKFEDVTARAHAGAGRRHHLAGAFFFYDDDHYPDIYTADDFSPNKLLRNRGDGTFEDVSESSGGVPVATSMGVAAGDTDNDGTSDLYVANMFSKMGRRIIGHVCADDYPLGIFEQIRGSCSGNQLFRRAPNRLHFDDVGEKLNIHGVGWAYAPALADFDNDGWLDIYATTGFLSFERGKPDG